VVDTAVPESLPRTQQARRQGIIAAAVELLEEGEYDTVQMRDVAERAGVALATIYRYFTSKEHLYAAALLEWAADYPVKGRALERSNGGDEARFRALMRRAVRAFERHPQMMRALIVLESSNDPNARALFQEFAKRNVDTLTAALGGMDADTAEAVVETANAVMVTRLRSWALGRCSIRDVDRSVQCALDLVFS
jgi:TetR/AcrR family transcriptional regulator, cholesterol catabolism regulator